MSDFRSRLDAWAGQVRTGSFSIDPILRASWQGMRRLEGLRGLAIVLGAAFLLRVLLAVVLLPGSGFRSDVDILTDWAHRLATDGLASFYRPDGGYFADYPPAYMYVLWLVGTVGQWWSSVAGIADFTRELVKVPFVIGDLATGTTLYFLGRQMWGERAGLAVAAAYLFNPGVLFLSTIWAQNDSVAVFPVVLSVYFLVRGRTELSAVAATVGLLVKFQYGFMLPIVGVVALRRHLFARSTEPAFAGRFDAMRLVKIGIVCFVTVFVISVPFGLTIFNSSEPSYSLWQRFVGASQAFPGVTQNAFNLWMNPFFNVIITGGSGLTEGHVVDDTVRILTIGSFNLTWQWTGNILFIAAVGLAMLVVAQRDDAKTIVGAALLLGVAFFLLPTRVHERYLYSALVLGAPLLFAGRGWRRAYLILSAVFFLDVYWVYTLPIGNGGLSRDPILNATILSAPGIYLLSFAGVLAFYWMAFKVTEPLAVPEVAPTGELAGRETTGEAAEGAATERTASDRPTTGTALAPGEPAGAGGTEAPPPAEPWTPRPAWIGPSVRLAEEFFARVRVGVASWQFVLVVVAMVSALLATRLSGMGSEWLWNLDMPKIDYPLAVFFHDALTHGHLPLWNDNLGLGYPLYAEGQIGAFYPPNWVIYQLPPLTALDVTRLLHLTIAGVGAGWLGLRISGSRTGALVACIVAVLGGAIVSKLEWTNFVAAYAWLPWVLLPLSRRPEPTRAGLVAAGILWGFQALAGHPNVWLLTGVSGIVLMLATSPRRITLVRVAGFFVIGCAVGAVQLIPTLLLTPLSVRNLGLSPDDAFTSAATGFDPLGFAFANVFAAGGPDGWDRGSNWYPDGIFALLEAAAYVSLPVLAMAAVGVRSRRAKPWLWVALVMLAIPVVAMIRPGPWLTTPILNGLRSPVRSYVVIEVVIGLVAALGVARLRRRRDGWRLPAVVVGSLIGFYLLVTFLASAMPDVFDALLTAFSSHLNHTGAEQARVRAVADLTKPLPFLAEVAIGGLAVGAIAMRLPRRTLALSLFALAAVPLALFSPQANTMATYDSFLSSNSEFTQALSAVDAHRVYTINRPGWYEGMPDQLAAAGVPDLEMFSSLNLLASDGIMPELKAEDTGADLRKAVGVDVVVTFGSACTGTEVATVTEPEAYICRIPDTTRPPYWIPASAVQVTGEGKSLPILGMRTSPTEATIDVSAALAAQEPAQVQRLSWDGEEATIDAPADGYVWFDRSWWPGWGITVDGNSTEVLRAMAGQLVAVPAGHHVLRQQLVPWDAYLGLVGGVGVVVLSLGWLWWSRRRAHVVVAVERTEVAVEQPEAGAEA